MTHPCKDWYVIYTRPKAEKIVCNELIQKNIETFLPLYYRIVQWSDRKKKILTPLFPGYVFVRPSISEIPKIFRINGFIRFLATRGEKDLVPNDQIAVIRQLVSSNLEVENGDDYSIGDLVMVNNGPLIGLTGKLVTKKSKRKIVIHIESILKNIVVELSGDDTQLALVNH